ncbi:MAG: 4-hydroxy-tetrahydrodipicolinate synthase [Rhodospirillaceae bacterium]|nr:4-hydroxy-tetrahydrodipicolinate synthase [Rhodospirillaceae bacterium]
MGPAFRGSITALITPFNGYAVNEKAFQSFVDWQIKEGSHGVVPCGTTGESPTLSHEEHRRLIELCIEVAKGRVPVIAGTGSNSTTEAIELTQHAKQAGADAALIVAPYYNKPTQEGLKLHFRAIADAVDIPIILYNVPGRTVVDISVETIIDLAKHPNIVGVKEATGDVSRATKIKLNTDENFCLLSGDDGTALGFLAHGGHGCISVTSNIAPRLCAQLQDAWTLDSTEDVARIRDILHPLHELLFVEPSPTPVKYAAHLLGKCEPDVRLPLAPLTLKTKARLEEAMRNAGLLEGY